VEVQDKSVEASIKEKNDQIVLELKEEIKKKECRVTDLEQEVCNLKDVLIDQHKMGELQGLREEVMKKDAKITDMEQDIYALEAALRDHSHMAELEELVGVVRQKDERIEELEEALRESVRITAEREMVLQQEETRRKQIMEKVSGCEKQKDFPELLISYTMPINTNSSLTVTLNLFFCPSQIRLRPILNS
jgi:ELKS/RAB6-interacting/CAST family protein 1